MTKLISKTNRQLIFELVNLFLRKTKNCVHINAIFTKFQDNIFKFENVGALTDEKSLVDEVDDVIVTEEDIDEELIEIDIDLSYDNSEVIQESVIRKVEKEVASIQVHEEEKPPPSLPIKVIIE